MTAARTTPFDVFLSYASEDKTVADAAASRRFDTEQTGFEIVWPGGNAAGIRRGDVRFLPVESDNRD